MIFNIPTMGKSFSILDLVDGINGKLFSLEHCMNDMNLNHKFNGHVVYESNDLC